MSVSAPAASTFTWSTTGSDMTPAQRNALVTRAIEEMRDLGLSLIPVTSHQAWKVDGDLVKVRYEALCETVRKMIREVDWPGGRVA